MELPYALFFLFYHKDRAYARPGVTQSLQIRLGRRGKNKLSPPSMSDRSGVSLIFFVGVIEMVGAQRVVQGEFGPTDTFFVCAGSGLPEDAMGIGGYSINCSELHHMEISVK